MNQVRKSQSVSLWIAVFSINFIFQLYRGFDPDLIYFGIALLLVILESVGLLDWIPERKEFRKSAIYLIPLFSIALIFSKRESATGTYLFYVLFLLMFIALWRKSNGDRKGLNKKDIAHAKILAGILIATCTWEIAMFTLDRITRDSYSYPTISVLLVPHLDGIIGRTIFVIVWGALGIFLLRDWDES